MWYTWLTETKYAIARGVFATATYEGGLNLILAPLCEGVLGPLPQRSRQTFLGRLRPTSQKNNPRAAGPSGELGVQKNR